MSHARPIIGWEREDPVPNHTFNDHLSARHGRLHFDDLDLAGLFLGDRPLPSPIEFAYLPVIRRKIARLQHTFGAAIARTGYDGKFVYAYTSKANFAEEVVRTALRAGVNYETTSALDIDIVRLMMRGGHLQPSQTVICNGFKPPGSQYSRNILDLKRDHDRLLPVLEDFDEILPLADSGMRFEVGIRQKCYGQHGAGYRLDEANSRFGMSVADVWRTAEAIAATPNLTFALYHAMIGSQITGEREFVDSLTPPLEQYASLRQRFPTLRLFDFGGGVPAPLTLNARFDYDAFATLLLETIQQICARYHVPVPDVVGELGRYTVAEHGAHFFKVAMVKDNASPLPWYMIDGSIMSSFPDTWAIGEHFIVLPLNHLDQPFRRVQLGGITCDSDDVYPPARSGAPLYLPALTDNLYIGFFSIGAYQEMLGGVGGTKHCVIPEADKLIVDTAPDGSHSYRHVPGPTARRILGNLGYFPEH